MVEHGRTEPVLGLAFDGLGYGPDGTLWGGELLVADLATATRAGHLRPVAMPGGTAAIREPWRMAAVWVASACGTDALPGALPGIDAARRDAVLAVAEAPATRPTTSMGRLFDAVAAVITGRTSVSYEAQAAIELEALARTVAADDAPAYDGVTVEGDQLDPSGLVARVVAERARGTDPALVAAGFHRTLGTAAAAWAASVAARSRLDTVALTGGVFQNALFSDIVESALLDAGLVVLVHAAIPPNDGGISIGQAAVAAWRARASPSHRDHVM
jgi:hydrogenase maturation protein HypF